MTFGKVLLSAEEVLWFWRCAESHAVTLYASSLDGENLTHLLNGWQCNKFYDTSDWIHQSGSPR